MAVARIRQTVTLPGSPHEVYEALMDSRTHGAFTGAPARISRTVGGTFSVFDGYAEGVNVELVQDRKIVQTWRADDWPRDHYSTIVVSLARAGKGTKLTFTQTGVPADQAASVRDGWKEFYWTPLKAMLARRSRKR